MSWPGPSPADEMAQAWDTPGRSCQALLQGVQVHWLLWPHRRETREKVAVARLLWHACRRVPQCQCQCQSQSQFWPAALRAPASCVHSSPPKEFKELVILIKDIHTSYLPARSVALAPTSPRPRQHRQRSTENLATRPPARTSPPLQPWRCCKCGRLSTTRRNYVSAPKLFLIPGQRRLPCDSPPPGFPWPPLTVCTSRLREIPVRVQDVRRADHHPRPRQHQHRRGRPQR